MVIRREIPHLNKFLRLWTDNYTVVTFREVLSILVIRRGTKSYVISGVKLFKYNGWSRNMCFIRYNQQLRSNGVKLLYYFRAALECLRQCNVNRVVVYTQMLYTVSYLNALGYFCFYLFKYFYRFGYYENGAVVC